MDVATWAEVKAVFVEALSSPPADRARLLGERCGDRAAMRGQVEALLAAHGRSQDFLEAPPAPPEWPVDPPPAPVADDRVGPFRLIAPIGAGGMGVVYRAERVDGGFEQQVAIKIIDIAWQGAEAMSRFRVERQVLASLNHPHIVQFIDGGLTADGRAFLVMELLDGVRVTEFCRDRRLALDARLQLVERICGAVQYAHQFGVLHCDIKPANILVSSDAVVKVLDFGVARMVAAGGDAERTATGLLRPLTPDYASPEQIRGLPVTIASDIYALGVLLYEIVTGRKPYETGGETLDRVLEMVVTQDPERPSRALAAAAADPPPYGPGLLRGDLDAIVLKSMHKDPAHRYGSAQELASDLARYRAGEPVNAREPSLGYLLRKTARRHRAAAAAAAVSLVAVLAALGVSLWQMQRVAAARDRAEARFNDARQIANALIFKVHDGIEEMPGSTPVRRMIVAEALTYLERLSQDPSVDDSLRLELASGYTRVGDVQGNPSRPNLGDHAGALASYQQAIRLLRPLASGPSPNPAALLQLGRAEQRLAEMLEDSAGAIEATKSAIATAERLLLVTPGDAAARNLLANTYFTLATMSGADALPHWQRAAGLYDAMLTEKPDEPLRLRNVALVEKHLGAHYERARDLTAALAHYSRAMALDERLLAAAPQSRNAIFDVAIDVGNVANIDWSLGRHLEAERGFQRSLAMRERLGALDPRDVQAQSRIAFMHARLSHFYLDMARQRDARTHARKAVAIMEALAAVDAGPRFDLASHLATLGQIEIKTGERVSGCRALRRSSALLAQIGAGGKAGPSPSQRDLQVLVGKELAACGPAGSAAPAGARR